MKRLIAALLLGLGMLGSCQAAIDTHAFANSSQRQRYYELTSVLRCPKCQDQNIAESNSPIASDLRNAIYRMLRDGRSDKQIINFMVSRYGDFILYDPPLTAQTALLWFGPTALLLVGAAAVAAIVANRRRPLRTVASTLSDGEQHRLDDLLRDKHLSIEQDP